MSPNASSMVDGTDGLPQFLRSVEPRPGPPAFEVRTNTKKGRHLVATRLIPAGEVIFSERPLVIAPAESRFDGKENGVSSCFGCCLNLTPSTLLGCSGCGAPLCGRACERSPLHREECALMQRQRYRYNPAGEALSSQLRFVAALRVLLLKGDAAARCAELKAHTEGAAKNPLGMLETSMAAFLYPPLRCFSNVEVKRAFSVLEINSFDYGEMHAGRSGVVLLHTGSFMNHSCVANAYGYYVRSAAGAEGTAAMRKAFVASTDIARGEEIVVNYGNPDLCALGRLELLESSKHFKCRCRRCTDPTELGLNTGGFCCYHCKGRGRLELLVPERAADPTAEWRCRRCRRAPSMSEMMQQGETMMSLNEEGGMLNIQALENFLEQQLYPRGSLHPTHGAVLSAKYNLVIHLYGRLPGFRLPELSETQLERLVRHARDMLAALDVAEPGYSPRRGLVMLALHRALMERVKRIAALPPPPEALATMSEAESLLRDVEVALRCSTDLGPRLRQIRSKAAHARRLLSWLGLPCLLPPPPSAANN